MGFVSDGIFEHLAEIDATLAALGRFAERCFVDDADAALMKTRQFAERLTFPIAEESGVSGLHGAAFADVLARLRAENAAPRDVVEVLHKLRKLGNSAVHEVQGDRREAFEAIKLWRRLGVWLRAAVGRHAKLALRRHEDLAPSLI